MSSMYFSVGRKTADDLLHSLVAMRVGLILEAISHCQCIDAILLHSQAIRHLKEQRKDSGLPAQSPGFRR